MYDTALRSSARRIVRLLKRYPQLGEFLCIAMIPICVLALVLAMPMASCGTKDFVMAQDLSNSESPSDFEVVEPWRQALICEIEQGSDDGTEIGGLWYPYGYSDGINYIGNGVSGSFISGFRFDVDVFEPGQTIALARMCLAAQGGELSSCATLMIRGIDEDRPAAFSDTRRPSQLPKTEEFLEWHIDETWEATGDELPLYYHSPNIAPIINEIITRPLWGRGRNGKVVMLSVEGSGYPEGEINYLRLEDLGCDPAGSDPARLEVYPTLETAFVGKPLLGRPTDTSITINVVNLLPIDLYVEYGLEAQDYTFSTSPVSNPLGGEPTEIVIEDLEPNTMYYYRIRYRSPDAASYVAGPEGRFHTQRSEGSAFVFAIQADSHLYLHYGGQVADDRLYKATLNKIISDQPDFLIDLGDFGDLERSSYVRGVLTQHETTGRYLEQRKHLDRIAHSVPFYLVLGNHEGEAGWRAVDDNDPLEEWAATARKKILPNPYPDGFYTGNLEIEGGCGFREDYYAWEWGDALFVVLDPFWYTEVSPHSGDPPYSGWSWTLGEEQYNWLYDTLHNSDARWKFVFSHHMTGGIEVSATPPRYYGRGGIEAAKYRVDNRPSFEWGGEDADGSYVFDIRRPGWSHGPIHDMFVAEGVSVFFHGHDHVYVHQVLDGVIYQTCPRPNDSSYNNAFLSRGGYIHGVDHRNSGYLRVTVSPDQVLVEYVRSVLEEDEPLQEDDELVYDGTVSHSYSLGAAGIVCDSGVATQPGLFPNCPNPFASSTCIRFHLPQRGRVLIEIYDIRGRLVKRLLDEIADTGLHSLRWEGTSEDGAPVAPGIYLCRLSVGSWSETHKMLLVK